MRARYSRWDGTQELRGADAAELFDEISDDLLYHGDPNQALRRLMQSGFRGRGGRRTEGLRELMERVRQRRREILEQNDLDSAYEKIVEKLRSIVEHEREGIDDYLRDSRASGDQRRGEKAEALAAERRMDLDLLPPDLPGKIRALGQHEWTSSRAKQEFDQLMEELQSQASKALFDQMSQTMSAMSEEDRRRVREMTSELNRMLEARAEGRDTDQMFADFMSRYGDMFDPRPEDLDALLAQMTRQMAAMQQLLNSMSPEQRQELQSLSEMVLSDMDLRWEMERLGANLRAAFPEAGWEQGFDFSGEQPMDMGSASDAVGELGELDSLEDLLSAAANGSVMPELDTDRVGELLGEDAARSLERLKRIADDLREAGLLDRRGGRLLLTPAAIRRIGRNALADLFARLEKQRPGQHSVDWTGTGHDLEFETKRYEWGDPFNLSIERTVRNAIARSGPGTPVHLTQEDFEVERTSTTTRTSTVVLLDLSLSMPMRDNFLPAKKVAMALHSLVELQYPHDYLGLVGFGELAREVSAGDLPDITWDYTFGTNIHHALLLARSMLSKREGSKQVLLITDGEPTAHLTASGEPFFSYPPVPETIATTLAEVRRCTKEGIVINSFVLDADGALRRFTEEMVSLNKGRAFFVSPDSLGDYVLVDFMSGRRVARRSR